MVKPPQAETEATAGASQTANGDAALAAVAEIAEGMASPPPPSQELPTAAEAPAGNRLESSTVLIPLCRTCTADGVASHGMSAPPCNIMRGFCTPTSFGHCLCTTPIASVFLRAAPPLSKQQTAWSRLLSKLMATQLLLLMLLLLTQPR